MYVDVARDFVDVAFQALLDGIEGSHNHPNCCCFELPHSLYLDFQIFVFVNLFRGVEGKFYLSCSFAQCPAY